MTSAALQTTREALHDALRRPWTVMEVCGGQTHSILRWGLDQLLPQGLELIHGPGCPVCVTPAYAIDQALQLALQAGVILCSYGDMLRVPGTGADLLQARAAGADVRLVTSPLQVVQLAQEQPGRQVVFWAVGFETTAPATAVMLEQARRLQLHNLTVLTAHVRVVPAMQAVLAAPGNRVQAFLAAGHVAAVMGGAELQQLVSRYRIPVVISGFAPQELLQALLLCVRLLESGTAALANAYRPVVRPDGNPAARALLERVFAPSDGPWRGLGPIAAGVLQLRPAYRPFDARRRFGLDRPASDRQSDLHSDQQLASACRSAAVLQGRCRPNDCPSFATACTPQHPLGAPMVSAEGACAAYYAYRR